MQTIGERLEDARKRKGISIREAAEATKIRGDYLQRFESNQFDLSLADIYVRGFLRSYAQFLNLPADRIVHDFNGLGLAAGGRARTPSREVYGRMDLSVASAEEGAARESAAPAASAADSAATSMRRIPPSFTRGGGSLHTGPSLNPVLVFKGALVIVSLVVLALIIWGLKSLLGSDRAKPAAAPPASVVQAVPEQTITLVAHDVVRVTVNRKNSDKTPGEELFKGTLVRGQTQVVPKPGPLYITATAAENLEIEVNGRRWPTGQTGNVVMELK
ncbi:MAG: XRE family transcriptional regulator [Opitutaceae bacterium]|nr:XRE family transcriptional regulator [Opitutaceae bacterium]